MVRCLLGSDLTFIVVQGSRSFVYSLVVDSMRKAYFPFDSLTRCKDVIKFTSIIDI